MPLAEVAQRGVIGKGRDGHASVRSVLRGSIPAACPPASAAKPPRCAPASLTAAGHPRSCWATGLSFTTVSVCALANDHAFIVGSAFIDIAVQKHRCVTYSSHAHTPIFLTLAATKCRWRGWAPRSRRSPQIVAKSHLATTRSGAVITRGPDRDGRIAISITFQRRCAVRTQRLASTAPRRAADSSLMYLAGAPASRYAQFAVFVGARHRRTTIIPVLA